MRSRWLAAARVLAGCAFVAVSAGAGCATATSSQTVSGNSLTIYLSAPASLASDPEAQDVIRAERVALGESCTAPPSSFTTHAAGFTITVETLSSDKLSDDARTAIDDTSTIAYLGEVLPGASADSLGITNGEDVLQVSPTDTAVALTQKDAAVAGSPHNYYESFATYGQTFARLVPTSSVEAAAIAKEISSLGVKTLYSSSDGSDYGRASLAALRQDAAQSSVTTASSPASADAVFYSGTDAASAAKLLDQAAASNPHVKLFVPSGLDDGSFAALLSAAAQRALYVSSPGFAPGAQPAEEAAFTASFKSACGHAPAPGAVFGAAAVDAVLGAIRAAGGSANNRSTVIGKLIRHTVTSSPIGQYSIDSTGDTSLGVSAIVFNHVRAGRLVPLSAPRARG